MADDDSGCVLGNVSRKVASRFSVPLENSCGDGNCGGNEVTTACCVSFVRSQAIRALGSRVPILSADWFSSTDLPEAGTIDRHKMSGTAGLELKSSPESRFGSVF